MVAVVAAVAVAAPQTQVPDPPRTMPRTEFRAMGSKILAILDADEPVPLFDDVAAWFEEWEQVLSRFRLDSELSRLNARAGENQAVSECIWQVLQVALQAEALTDGLVNPLILEALVQAGYDRTFDLIEAGLPSEVGYLGYSPAIAGAEWHMAYPLPPLSSILLDSAKRTVRIPVGMGLDFGGVAKGWAAQQAMTRLSTAGPALVSAGGDVAVSAPRRSGEPWRIGVEDPAQRDRYLEMLYVERGGVATSGRDHRHWQRAGAFQHHIIDPRTQLPAETDIMAVTVVASTVMRAEALAKAALIVGSDAALELLEAHPDAEAILVLDSGQLLYSRNIEMYL
jgi:FAD:protein FMN transferase